MNDVDKFINKEVNIKGEVMLQGTLTMPNSMTKDTVLPAVLILPGTGTLNRDGNMDNGKMNLNLYRKLAEFITSLGFITFRYDKRGVGKSEGKIYETGMWDLVDDAEVSLEYLRNYPNVNLDKVFVLGHSEGAILATALNARNPVSGLILLSGAGSKLHSAIEKQQELVYSELEKLKGFKGFLVRRLKVPEKLRKKNANLFNEMLNTEKDIIRINFIRTSSKWFKEHFRYDLYEDYRKITCPVLAITGKKDVQSDYRVLEILPIYIHSSLETYVIESMNHGLREQNEDLSILDAKKQFEKDMHKDLHYELKLRLSNWLMAR